MRIYDKPVREFEGNKKRACFHASVPFGDDINPKSILVARPLSSQKLQP